MSNDGRLTSSTRSKLKSAYEDADREAAKEEEVLRKALDKIYEIRRIRSEIRIAARNAGNKETIRRGALMKMLATSAETIPLFVGSVDGEGKFIMRFHSCMNQSHNSHITKVQIYFFSTYPWLVAP